MRTLIVDDHPLYADALQMICAEMDLLVVGLAPTGREAMEKMSHTKPELVLFDLGLPDIDGLNLIPRLHALHPLARFLIISGRCDPFTCGQIPKIEGIVGFVDKNGATFHVLKEALAQIKKGQPYYSDSYLQTQSALASDPRSFTRLLTDRELELLPQLSSGLKDEEIAQQLGISPRTISTHRSNILRKLGVDGTPKLIALCHSLGLPPKPSPPHLLI